jgi:hypothetical protein
MIKIAPALPGAMFFLHTSDRPTTTGQRFRQASDLFNPACNRDYQRRASPMIRSTKITAITSTINNDHACSGF